MASARNTAELSSICPCNDEWRRSPLHAQPLLAATLTAGRDAARQLREIAAGSSLRPFGISCACVHRQTHLKGGGHEADHPGALRHRDGGGGPVPGGERGETRVEPQ